MKIIFSVGKVCLLINLLLNSAFALADPERSVAIIGVGPRGTYLFNSLVSKIRIEQQLHPELAKVHFTIHLVDPAEFGAGQVYRTNQPAFLLLNSVSSQITAYPDESIPGFTQSEYGPSLKKWLNEIGIDIKKNDYPSRAQHGLYLDHVVQDALAHKPENVEVVLHKDEATDVENRGSQVQVSLKKEQTPLLVDKVVLTTGHSFQKESDFRDLEAFAAEQRKLGNSKTAFFDQPYPVESKIIPLGEDRTIGVIGLGLSFIDIMVASSEGRGGRFVENADGRLEYVKSGKEPHLVAWCRSGLPLSARGENQRSSKMRRPARFVTHRRIDEMRRASPNGKLNYSRDFLPELKKEVELAYYETLLGKDFGQAYLQASSNPDALHALIMTVPETDRFNWEKFWDPFAGRTFSTEGEYRDFLMRYLEWDLSEAKKGNMTSPIKAASEVLRDIRDEIRYLVDFGGMDAESHQRIAGEFTSFNNRVSVGPPLRRIEQMLALVRAGVLDIFAGPRPRLQLDAERGQYRLESTAFVSEPRFLDVVVGGMIPTTDVTKDRSQLVRSLLTKGVIRPFRNVSGDREYRTGGIEINRQLQVIGKDNQPNPNFFAFGVPTEGTVLYSTASARPHNNSRALTDARQLADFLVKQLGGLERNGSSLAEGARESSSSGLRN